MALSQAPDQRLDLAPYACTFVDTGGTLNLDALAAPERAQAFRPVHGALVDFGFGDGLARYWVRLRLENPGTTEGIWWLTHDIPVAQGIDVYLLPDEGDTRRLLSLTAADPFDARPIAHRHLVSEIALDAGHGANVFITYHTDQATEMPLFIETVPGFLKRAQGEAGQILALTALIFGMGLISTVYLYSLDGQRAFAYGGYMLCSVVFLVHMDGFAFQFLWPGLPGFNQVALAILSALSVALGINFIAQITDARQHARRMHQLAIVTMALLLATIILAVPLISTLIYKNTTLLIVGFATLLQVALALSAVRRKMPGAIFLVIGFGALALSFLFGIFGYFSEGLFAQELVGIALRTGFLAEALAFSTAIALRITAARRERDRYLREQLRLSEERLHLSEALRRAEDDRQRTAAAMQRSHDALETTAHDIRQPLVVLRMALAGKEDQHPGLRDSLNYLDDILRTGLEVSARPLGSGDNDPPQAGAQEHFSLDIILQNLQAMFATEATRQKIALRVVPSGTYIHADPLSVMRSLGNLVSNALQHSGAQHILVGCRRNGQTIAVEVHDDGSGMSRTDRARVLERGVRGQQSAGSGLGLAIVAELAEQNGAVFDLQSHPGRGTIARLSFPRAQQASTGSDRLHREIP
ncbi:sensor histidine kinase [Leisingera sp. S232]|uniref:sensor histidine kinase n=1 Tax=Leisingera sp. S232 TaxID=3415132 RepID=UPI003C7E099A